MYENTVMDNVDSHRRRPRADFTLGCTRFERRSDDNRADRLRVPREHRNSTTFRVISFVPSPVPPESHNRRALGYAKRSPFSRLFIVFHRAGLLARNTPVDVHQTLRLSQLRPRKSLRAHHRQRAFLRSSCVSYTH